MGQQWVAQQSGESGGWESEMGLGGMAQQRSEQGRTGHMREAQVEWGDQAMDWRKNWKCARDEEQEG